MTANQYGCTIIDLFEVEFFKLLTKQFDIPSHSINRNFWMESKFSYPVSFDAANFISPTLIIAVCIVHLYHCGFSETSQKYNVHYLLLELSSRVDR